MNLDWSGEKTVEGPRLQYLGIDACLMQQQGMVEDRERFAFGVGILQKLGIAGVVSLTAKMRNAVAQFCARVAARPQPFLIQAQRQCLQDLEQPLLERLLFLVFKPSRPPSFVTLIT